MRKILSAESTAAVCTDGPRDDVGVGDPLTITVKRLGPDDRRPNGLSTIQVEVVRDDVNQHGIIEFRMSVANFARLAAGVLESESA